MARAVASDPDARAGVAQGLGQAGTAAQLPVERDHERHYRRVVHRNHTGHDPGGAQRDQRAGQPEHLVGTSGRGDARVAARQDQVMRPPPQPLQVVDGQRPVVELQRGEQRAVRAESAVRRDVHQPGAVDRAQDPRRCRGAVAEHHGAGVIGGERGTSAPAGSQARTADQDHRAGRVRVTAGPAARMRRGLAGPGATTPPTEPRSAPGSAAAAAAPTARLAGGRAGQRSHRRRPGAHRPRRAAPVRAVPPILVSRSHASPTGGTERP